MPGVLGEKSGQIKKKSCFRVFVLTPDAVSAEKEGAVSGSKVIS
jgi:hypothetical protein